MQAVFELCLQLNLICLWPNFLKFPNDRDIKKSLSVTHNASLPVFYHQAPLDPLNYNVWLIMILPENELCFMWFEWLHYTHISVRHFKGTKQTDALWEVNRHQLSITWTWCALNLAAIVLFYWYCGICFIFKASKTGFLDLDLHVFTWPYISMLLISKQPGDQLL